MSESMRGFHCWNAKSVRETVYSDIGSLPRDAEAVFLAAHSPMRLSHRKGQQTSDAAQGEQQVLDALLAGIGDPDRNTLIAVTGAPGTGKSHVVRWVHAHLNRADEQYHILYVPRAVQTVRTLLRSIVAGLPDQGGDEGAEFMAQIDQAVGVMSPAEFQDRLLEQVRLALTWTLEPQPPRDDEDDSQRADREERTILLGEADEQGKRRNGLADLLALSPVNRKLLREGGRLHRYAASVYEETSRRDGDDGFTPADLPLNEPGVLRALASNQDLQDLWTNIIHNPKPTLDLLTEALDKAAPQALGISGPGGRVTLDELFRLSREVMYTRGRELVLLFEDLAQFGLIDGELYDQFATQPAEGLCPLRVVFAVTDDPYGKLPLTVTSRITHRFQVESSAFSDRTAFVARYLNLVRTGRSGVETAWASARGEPDWIPNACDAQDDGLPCRFRDTCHEGFGAVDVPGLGRVGLYPFNHSALGRSLDFPGVEQTPRAVLDHSIIETLLEAETHLDKGDYPHPRVAERFEYAPRRAPDMLTRGPAGAQTERLYRAMVIWGDESNLHPVVTDAFAVEPSEQRPSPAEPDHQPPAAVSVIPPGPTAKVSVERRPSPVPALVQWRAGLPLPGEDSDLYRQRLVELVRARVGLDHLLIHTTKHGSTAERILNELLTRRSFVLEGARGQAAGAGKLRFDLARNDADLRLLIAARWFHDNGHWRPDGGIWEWPDPAYDPADLMIELESRLDVWADQVRREFLRRVGDRYLPQAAVGARAVAMLAGGVRPEEARQLRTVMQDIPARLSPATPAWKPADIAARDLLRNATVLEVATEFAGVRQGLRGEITLLDSVALEAGLTEALRGPFHFLTRVSRDFEAVEPVLAAAARALAEAIGSSAAEHLVEIRTAVRTLNDGLEGRAPNVVAQAAREVGERAMTTGVFKPSDGWSDYKDAFETLRNLSSDLPLDWTSPDGEEDAVDVVLRAQHWCRNAVPGAKALEIILQSMEATVRECERTDRASGDLGRLRDTVRIRLKQTRDLLASLQNELGGQP